MEDITETLEFATTPQAQAAQDIDRAKLFNLPHDNYVELKPEEG